MDGACGRHGGKNKFIKGFGGESWRKKILENLGVDGRLTLIFILKKKEGMTSPKPEQWLNVVNMVMNLWVPQSTGYFLTN